jgi:hypothetical protein
VGQESVLEEIVPLEEQELWTTAKSLEIQRATENLIALETELQAAKGALELNPADQELRRKYKELTQDIVEFKDQVGHSDVGSTSLALSVIEQQIEHAGKQAKQMQDCPDGVTPEVANRIRDLHLQAGTLKKSLNSWGVNSCVSVLAEVKKNLALLEAELRLAPQHAHEISVKNNGLELQAKALKIIVDEQGGWRAALHLDAGELDHNVNLEVWDRDEQIEILKLVKDNLHHKVTEQQIEFADTRRRLRQKLKEERDKFSKLASQTQELATTLESSTTDESIHEREKVADVNLNIAQLHFEVEKLFIDKTTRQKAINMVAQEPMLAPNVQEPNANRSGGQTRVINQGITSRQVLSPGKYMLAQKKTGGAVPYSEEVVLQPSTAQPVGGLSGESELDLKPLRQVLKDAYEVKQTPPEHVNVIAVLGQALGVLDKITETVRVKLQPKTAYDQNLEMLVESLVDRQVQMGLDISAATGSADEPNTAVVGKLQNQIQMMHRETKRLESQIQADKTYSSTAFGCLERTEGLIAKDRLLVQSKASLVLQKFAIQKQIDRLKAELREDLNPKTRMAVEHAKKGCLSSLLRLRHELDSVHLERKQNMSSVVGLFTRVDAVSRTLFNGTGYQAILEWNQQHQKKHRVRTAQHLDATAQNAQTMQAPPGASWFEDPDRTSAVGHAFSPALAQLLPDDFLYGFGSDSSSTLDAGEHSGVIPSDHIQSSNRREWYDEGLDEGLQRKPSSSQWFSLPPLQQASSVPMTSASQPSVVSTGERALPVRKQRVSRKLGPTHKGWINL